MSKTQSVKLGVDRQRRTCQELIERQAWRTVAEFVDNDRSAYRAKHRPQFERLLTAMEAGEVDAVVAYAQDRLARARRTGDDGSSPGSWPREIDDGLKRRTRRTIRRSARSSPAGTINGGATMARAELVELDPKRPDSYSTRDGEKRLRGVTLRHLLEELGGVTGVMVDPETGGQTTIDLSQWEGRDPDITFIQLRWYFDNPTTLEMTREPGTDPQSYLELVRHLSIDHHIPPDSISSTPELQHEELHKE